MWVRKIQLAALEILAQADTPEELAGYIPDVFALVERARRDLKAGRVPLEELIVRQKLSRVLDGYKSPSPAARAAMQLKAMGREIAPGQSVAFLFTRGGSEVHAWELGEALNPGRLDTKRYFKLLDRAIQTVLDPHRRSCVSERLL